MVAGLAVGIVPEFEGSSEPLGFFHPERTSR